MNEAISRINNAPAADIYKMANSYFGLLGQATKSHHDRAKLAKAILQRGMTVNYALTKTYRNQPCS